MAERPKRRKHKDNPYTLNQIEEKNIYIITFIITKTDFKNNTYSFLNFVLNF